MQVLCQQTPEAANIAQVFQCNIEHQQVALQQQV
jgi:hypothetical protein